MWRLYLCCLLAPALASGALTRVHVIERSDVLGGRSLGPAGAYERILAKAHFEIDPDAAANKAARDLEFAPRNERGMVEFSADLHVLKPVDPAKGNGTLLFEVVNRGRKLMLLRFNLARGANDPRAPEEFGDLWLMSEGYTLAWLGWQWDLPHGKTEDQTLVRLDAPIATRGGEAITGLVRSEFIPAARATVMSLADRDHIAYPALEDQGMEVQLTVRTAANGPRRVLPASSWRFSAGRTAIERQEGFEPGHIYEVVYRARDPRVQGVSLAAVRDLASFLKHEGSGLTALGDQSRFLNRAIAFGISQSGRFLRTFLYHGFNADEKGRMVFDAIWSDVAGAGRGSFNQRFAQPSRDGYAYHNLFYPTDLFPFTDLPHADPETGETAGLLDRTPAAVMPKIVYTNGGTEYWTRAAALVHVTPDGRQDAPLPANVRIYALASTQHGPGSFPPARAQTRYLANPVDFRPFQRAILAALHEWVRDGKEPPPSRYPKLTLGELVPREKLKFPAPAGVTVPARAKLAWRSDYGPDFAAKGIATVEPPRLGKPYPLLLPQVDAGGIELGGIRMPDVAVPLGVYTGWNLRPASAGAPTEMAGLAGAFFPMTPAQARTRYGSREAYLDKVAAAAGALIAERFLLARDKDAIVERAGRMWDAVISGELK